MRSDSSSQAVRVRARDGPVDARVSLSSMNGVQSAVASSVVLVFSTGGTPSSAAGGDPATGPSMRWQVYEAEVRTTIQLLRAGSQGLSVPCERPSTVREPPIGLVQGSEHDQLELVGGQVVQPSPLATTPESGKVSSIAAARKKRDAARRPGLRELPDHLPRRTVVHTPHGGCNCEACGRGLHEIGQDVSEVLDYEPGSFHVVRHVRPKLACTGCHTISQAPAAGRRSRHMPFSRERVLAA